jgi:hypothetical protein
VILVNETQQSVTYRISAEGVQPETGTLEVDGLVDLPAFDNQTNVGVQFTPVGAEPFQIQIKDTRSGEQVEMAVKVE